MDTSSLHFSRDLLTPRKDISDRDPELRRSPLVSSQRLRRIEAVYEGSERHFDDAVEAADEVGHMVRQTLSFGSLVTRDVKLWGWDEGADTVRTNCFGHTVVTSELLDAVGIEHYVSFVNAHSFITLFDQNGRRAHMVDSPTKDLFLDIDGAVIGKWPNEALEQDPDSLFATNMLDTVAVLGRITRKPSSQILLQNDWLRGGASKALKPNYDETLSSTSLIMRSYPSEIGRDVLVNYGMTLQYALRGDIHSAIDRFRRLEGVYPDIDIANQLFLAKKLRDRLLKEKLYGEMEDIARVVDNSLVKEGPHMDRTPNKYFLLDTLRMIAFANNDPELLRGVADAYSEFGTDRLTRGKVQRARQLALVAGKRAAALG